MKRVSSPIPGRRELATAILRLRTIAYAVLAGIVAFGLLSGAGSALPALIGLILAGTAPFFAPVSAGWSRVEHAMILDVAVALLMWWRLPGDPVVPLIMSLWAVAVAAAFCSRRDERIILAMVGTVEAGKFALSATILQGRFGSMSFFHTLFESELIVQVALSLSRLGAIAATYVLFRAIAQTHLQSEAAIEEGARRFRRLVDSSPNAILILQDGMIRFANLVAPQMFGLDHSSQLVGRSIFDLAGRGGLTPDILDHTQADGRTQRFHGVHIDRTDGADLFVDLTLAPTLHDGAPAAQVLLQDATERHKSAQRLAESEERYRRFFERLPVALYRTSPDGRIIDANPELARLLGAGDPASLLHVNASDFYIDADDRSTFSDSIRTDGFVRGHEVALRQPSGDVVWVRDSAAVVDGPDQQIYEGALIDITERKEAEEEVEKRAHQQEAVANIGHLALTEADLDTVFLAAAQTLSDQLGADMTSVVRQLDDGSFVIEAELGPPEAAAVGDVPDDEETEHLRFVLASDAPVLMPSLVDETRFSLSPRLAASGGRCGSSVKIPGQTGPIGVLNAYWTETRDLSENDLHFVESLASILGAAIERHSAAEQLEQLVRSKDQFVAAVSHEVRTPLTVVSGIAHELHERWQDFGSEEIAELIALLVDQSQDMADLIEDLLVSARADIGRIQIRPEHLRLDAHAAAVLDPLQPAEARRIAFEGPETLAIADPVRLRQIMRNLISNAIRYGGPSIRIQVGNGGSDAYVEVRDNGEPIAVQDRERIFEPYHRAHTFAGRTSPVGLGLAVSRTLAELMNGTLTYTHDGESVFRLTLPAA